MSDDLLRELALQIAIAERCESDCHNTLELLAAAKGIVPVSMVEQAHARLEAERQARLAEIRAGRR